MRARRRSRVEVAVTDPLPERPPRPHEIAAQLAARQPVQTNAQEVDESPCAACGGPCGRSEDTWGPWRRHRACAGLMSYPTRRIEAACRALAIELNSDADLVPFMVPAFHTVHPEPTWTDEPTRSRLPWRHVDRTALAAAVEELPVLRAEAGRVEVECTDGWCAWCGVAESTGWATRGHTWPDGTAAPLCGSCAEVYDSSGEVDPHWWDGQRALLAQALTGVPQPMGHTPPAGLRAYAEAEMVRSNHFEGAEAGSFSSEPTAEAGREDFYPSPASDGTPWSHLPSDAVEGFRWAAWGLYGGRYAPAEHQTEALRRAEAARAAKAARRAAQDAEQAARADVYGFTGPR